MTEDEINEGRMFPNLNRIQEVSFQIAIDISEFALKHDLCDLKQGLTKSSVQEHLKELIYQTDY